MGTMMGFHHLLLKGNYMYDPVIKVPLIVKFPDRRNMGVSLTPWSTTSI